jgi:hypothetical protein
MRRWMPAAAVIAAFAAAMPAAAQQTSAPWNSLPRPTDAGKPLIDDPRFVARGDYDQYFGCTPGLQCRLRLLGVIQNNGAVELRATAFKW